MKYEIYEIIWIMKYRDFMPIAAFLAYQILLNFPAS